MRLDMMSNATRKTPTKAPAKAPKPESGFKINPLIAAGAAALVPIFGAMA
jgi:hypothetical protein